MTQAKNNSLAEIAQAIRQANTIFIFSHVAPDGDNMGSSIALQKTFTKMGKTAKIFLEDEVPEFIRFLVDDTCTDKFEGMQGAELSFAVDCGDLKRLGKRQELFSSGKATINIDHHMANTYFAGLNYVDESASATAEIIFDLIDQLEVNIDKDIANAIYTGITTDTGKFQYSNTTAKTHRIVAQLYETGFDATKTNMLLFQSENISRKKMIAKIIDTLELFEDGKIATAFITGKMVQEAGAKMSDTEGSIDEIRSIKGVEVAVFFKEIEPNLTRVNLRSKEYANVNDVATKFGGGGHKRAAGCTIEASLSEAKAKVVKELQERFHEWNH